MWSKVVQSGLNNRVRGRKRSTDEAPVVLETDTPEKRPNEPESTAIVTTLTSLVVAVAATRHQRSPGPSNAYVSRKSPNSRGRKGTIKGPFGIQAGDRREICAEILHHKSRWNCCSSVSLRGMGGDRTEAGVAIHFQSDEEEISQSHELLRAGRRDGRAGAPADPADLARVGADTRRSGSARQSDLPGGPELGSVP